MKLRLFPDKVEGKIFLLVLVISLSMCLLATRLIVMSQEGNILLASRTNLTAETDLFVDRLEQTLRSHESHVNAFNQSLVSELSTTPASTPELHASKRIRIYGPSVNTWRRDTHTRVALLADAIENMGTLAGLGFDRVFVRLIDPGITIELTSDASVSNDTFPPIDVTDTNPENNPDRVPVWTASIKNENPSELWARVLVPMEIGGTFIGVTGGDFRFQDELVVNALANTRSDRTMIILDSKDRLINTNTRRPPDAVVAAMKDLPRSKSNPEITQRTIELQNESVHIYLTELRRLGWRVASVVDTRALYAQLTQLKWKLNLSAIVLALILVLLLRASFRQLFINRVLSLEKTTRSFAQHGVANFPNLGNDEIGSLAHAFEEMVESLASREAELTIRNQQLKNEISGRLSAVESLRESERKFRTLFDKSSDAILVFDGERYIDCNEAATDMLGFPSKPALLVADPASLHPPLQPDGAFSDHKESEMFDIAKRKGEHRYEWVCSTVTGREFWVEVVLTLIPYGGREVVYMVWRDISDRKREEEERVRLTTALEQAAETIIVTDTNGIIQYVNPSFERMTQYTRDEAVGQHNDLIHSDKQDASILNEMRTTIRNGKVWKGRIANTRKNGTLYQAETTISPVRDATGAIINFVIVSYDVTKEATLEAQLIQAQKMEAIGELASGIAHEINTPTQYIGDNIRFFQESFRDILKMIEKCEALVQLVTADAPAQSNAQEIEALIKEIDLDYLKEEIPIAIGQSIEGNSRVAEIVRAMKEFAHPGIEEKTAVDINHAIRNTIAVARNEWKYVADINLDLDEQLPEVPCLPGSFNQVILNIVVNASHAIADVVGDGDKGKGTIAISTRAAEGWAEIRISDTGTGIPEAIRNKIFDPFFTTKGVGKGTGQGLALVHSVIVEKHAGTIAVESAAGEGTTFIIRLPLAETQAQAEDDVEIVVHAET